MRKSYVKSVLWNVVAWICVLSIASVLIFNDMYLYLIPLFILQILIALQKSDLDIDLAYQKGRHSMILEIQKDLKED